MKRLNQIAVLLIMMIAFIKTFAAEPQTHKITVYNNTDRNIRVGINNPDPNDGKITGPQKGNYFFAPDNYTVTVCWADQDRSNHCMCKRRSCDNSPGTVIAEGSVNGGCLDDTLQLHCSLSP